VNYYLAASQLGGAHVTPGGDRTVLTGVAASGCGWNPYVRVVDGAEVLANNEEAALLTEGHRSAL